MINDLKDFEKFLKICRKQGVTDVSIQGVSVKLGNLSEKPNSSDEEIPTDELSPDELLSYYLQGPGANQ